MPDSPWLTLRQAQEAVSNHRPEEAHRLLEPLIAEGHKRAWKLARDVVRAYLTRASKSLDQHNADAAWRDLLAAEALNTGEPAVTALRQTLSRLGLVEARAALEAGNPVDAIAALGRLQSRGVRHPDLAQLEELAQDWGLAAELADRGEFLRATAELDRLRPKLPCPTTGLDRFREEVEDRHTRFRAAVARLYDAAEVRLWREALDAADAVLAIAPEHREARAIRGKAWLAAGPMSEAESAKELLVPNAHDGPSRRFPRDAETIPYPPGLPAGTQGPSSSATAAPSLAGTSLPKRFLLWVDGVGGYLVCLSTRVTFGQATGDAPVDVPLFADVSRLHAELTRDGEGYVLSSGKSLLVNGKECTRAVLAPGDRITFGATCQFLFHKPVPVSSTARLQLTSGHRLPVAVDAVLLMGNELMLGPEPDSHILLPGVSAPVLLYRSKDGLGVRVPNTSFRIDDRRCTDRAPLPLPSVVTTDAFTFAVEAAPTRL